MKAKSPDEISQFVAQFEEVFEALKPHIADRVEAAVAAQLPRVVEHAIDTIVNRDVLSAAIRKVASEARDRIEADLRRLLEERQA
jgi:hypothetical protein